MLQWRYAAALLCLEMYSVLANTSHPDIQYGPLSLHVANTFYYYYHYHYYYYYYK